MKRSKKKSSSFTHQYVIIFGLLLAVANLLLGIVLIQRSTATVRNLIRKNMLDLSNTAASLIEGDELASLTEENVGSQAYRHILEELTAFQNNVDIEYIYAVKPCSDGTFIFTVDADPGDPAQYGEKVLVTDALISAAQGTASVDDSPAADEWGNFYSSYSPVYDSKGEIAGIIGVDFDSEWYENQIRSNTSLILVISALFVLVGIVVFILISRRLQARFTALNHEIITLAEDIDSLTRELTSDEGYISSLSELEQSGQGMPDHTASSGSTDSSGKSGQPGYDEIEELSSKIRSMHSEMKRYLEYAERRAVTDALTNVSNTTAYRGLQDRLNKEIAEGTASFSLVIFDINDLKITNDQHGHVYGDRIIHSAANAIASVFGTRNTFRIGGDELLAVTSGKDLEEMNQLVAQVEAAVSASNGTENTPGLVLSLSKGFAIYEPGKDTCYKDVFVRADECMYTDKQQYHSGKKRSMR